MTEIIKKLLFKSVVVILLLHACIPHKHRGEMTETAHIKLHQDNDSLIDVLKIVFHEGDDEHLDNLFFANNNFDTSAQHFSKKPHRKVTQDVENGEDSIQLSRISSNCTYLNIFIVKLNGLRAPPIIRYS